MASATVKVLLVALAFVATAATVRADDAPKVDAANFGGKPIVLYPIGTATISGGCGLLGSTGVIV